MSPAQKTLVTNIDEGEERTQSVGEICLLPTAAFLAIRFGKLQRSLPVYSLTSNFYLAGLAMRWIVVRFRLGRGDTRRCISVCFPCKRDGNKRSLVPLQAIIPAFA